MAKDIRECLLEQARKFHQWQEITYPGKTTEEIGGAWEVDYPAWNDIFDPVSLYPLPVNLMYEMQSPVSDMPVPYTYS